MNTIILSVTEDAESTDRAIRSAADVIRRGGLVAFPTETVYGLGADGMNDMACRSIFAAKGRPGDNPLILHIAYPEDAEKYAKTSRVYERLASEFMPGPITVIMPAREQVPLSVTAGLKTVALRCPIHNTAHRLICAAGTAIAAPSANLSGSPSPTCARYVIGDMMGRIDMILDGGDCDIGVESTIVKINHDSTVTLLRPGAVTPEMLRGAGLEVSISPAVCGELKPGEKAESPGMKYKHYAPKASLILLNGTDISRQKYISEHKENTSVLCYTENRELYCELLGKENVFDLGEKEDDSMHARRLFTLLRDADMPGTDTIYAPLPNTEGMGLALYNRMIRASAHKIIKV